jgi:uncharacterized protein YbjT (DUF2867 family)
MSDATTLVVGASGKTGSRVMQRLQARGLPVRGASRSGQVPFDWEDRTTWGPALRGATAVYVSYFPDLAVPGAPEAIGAFAVEALETDVRRLVLLSGRGEEEAQRAERVVQQSGIEWSVVRCSWFNQNFSEGYLLEPMRAGEVVLPVGDVPEPFVDAEDVADVAVAALTEDGHAGRVYELTGPRLLTFADAVEEIARATGRPIAFVPVTMEHYAAAAAEDGLPDDQIWLLRYLFSEVLDGRNAHVNDGVQRALGREPRDFADFARDGAARGVWEG